MTVTAEQIDELLAAGMSPSRSRATVALGGVGLAEFVLITTMLATEPRPLPADTTAALGAVAGGGLVWALYAGWALRRRHVLLLADRVVAGAIATALSLTATVGAVAIAVGRDRPDAAAAAGVGGTTLVVLAGALLAASVRRHRAARHRLHQLETGTAGEPGP